MGGRSAAAPLEGYPATAESRARVIDCVRDGSDPAALVQAIEADPALVFPVLRLANRRAGLEGRVGSVSEAVRVLPPGTIAAVADSTPVSNRLEPRGRWGSIPERFRMHAVGVSRLVGRLSGVVGGGVAAALGGGELEILVTAALLHDVGKLAMFARDPAFDATADDDVIEAERDAFGGDHAQLGGEIVRAWGLPGVLAELVEQHNSATEGRAAALRLADLLNHYGAGRPVDLTLLVELGERLGLDRVALSGLLYELPDALPLTTRTSTPCPLSPRQIEVLSRLANGRVSKEIARELGLAESTVRNHLHRIYCALGVTDRTQAVLLARERGWM